MAVYTYFGGGNTGKGYEHFLRELRPRQEDARVCIVRGAVGTGRHMALAAAAAEWEKQGRNVIRYEGAEEPGHLAAVVSGHWAVLDGAVPLGPEAAPGDLEIDLSASIVLYALRSERARAGALYKRMHGLRKRAWRCLQVAHTAWSDSAAIYAEAVDSGALMNLRLELSRRMEGAPGLKQRVFAQAVTPEGILSHADNLLRPNTICLDMPWGFDPDTVPYPIAAALQLRGVGHIAAMQTLDGGRLQHLCTDTHAIVVFAEPGRETRKLPFDESVLRREQDALAFNRAAHDLWLRQAIEALAAARECR
ncbi:MAG: hypothetical protein IJ214_00275, partial [Clostridia bacterium]|nr:hypothetical protein [Clostridia bacterium]